MAGNFGIKFFTRGYQQTHREMSTIEGKTKAMQTGFMRMGVAGGRAGPLVAKGLGVVKVGLSAAMTPLRLFLRLTTTAIKVMAGLGVAVSAVGVALATKFSFGLMKTREGFYLIETALTGVVKNAATVRKISEWAMQYAAVYPAMYEDVMEAMKGMAMMPAMKPIFTKAQTEDMERIMNIVQGLAALDPQQGVKGALFAIREALAGQWRTLMYRFEIKPEAVAAAAGLSYEEIKKSPKAAIEALDAFVKLNVGADTLRKTAQSLGVQWGNLSDKYKMWLNIVAQYGAYQKLVKFLIDVNDQWENLLKGKQAEKFGKNISRIFEGAIEGLSDILAKDIDWEKAGIFTNLLQAGRNAMDKLKSIFDDAKDLLLTSMQLTMAYIAKGMFIFATDVFLPVGGEIARALIDGIKQKIRENPITTWIFSTLAGGMTGGVAGALTAGTVSAGYLAYDQLFGQWLKPQKQLATDQEAVGERIEKLKTKLVSLRQEEEKLIEAQAKPKTPGKYQFPSVVGTQLYELSQPSVEKIQEKRKRVEQEIKQLEQSILHMQAVADRAGAGSGFLAEKIAELKGKAKDAAKTFWSDIETRLPEGAGVAARMPTPADEARKTILEKEYQLRARIAVGTQKQIESAKLELVYAQKMLEFHEATERWEKDPAGGIRLKTIKEQIAKLNEARMDAINIGKKDEDLENRLLALQEKRVQLEKKMKTAIPAATRYTGEDLDRLIKERIEKEEKSKDVNEQIKTLESEIAGMRKTGVDDLTTIVEKQQELNKLKSNQLNLFKQLETRAKKLTLPEYDFTKWSLGKEMKGARERWKGDPKALALLTEIEKAELANIEEAHAEHLRRKKEAQQKFYREWLVEHGTATEGIKSGLDEVATKHRSVFQIMRDMTISTAQAMEEGFQTFFFDVMTGRLKSLGDYINSFLRSVQMALSQVMANQLVSGISGYFGGKGAPPASVEAAQAAMPTTYTAHGAAFEQSGIRRFATGGVVNRPTQFAFAGGVGLMGEAGPEAIMPLTRTPSGDLGVKQVQTQMPTEASDVNIKLELINESGQPLQAKQRGEMRTNAFGAAVQTVVLSKLSQGGPLRETILNLRA